MLKRAADDGVRVFLREDGNLVLSGSDWARAKWRKTFLSQKASLVDFLENFAEVVEKALDDGKTRAPTEDERRELWNLLCELTDDAEDRLSCFESGLREIETALYCYRDMVEVQRRERGLRRQANQ
jgi:hypothetical protein